MRRWIAVFFLVLFPLQAVWAAAAPYCQHESTVGSAHPGHHSHEHHTGDAQDEPLPGMDDGDCQACHAFGCALHHAVGASAGSFSPPVPAPASDPARAAPPPAPPERPNWPALA